jgi:hypothetical protein
MSGWGKRRRGCRQKWKILKRAEAVDAAEDAKYGKGQGGEELPAELARRESRLAKIRAAKAELEAEAKQKAEEKKAAAEAQMEQRREQEARTGKKVSGPKPQVPDPEQAVPDPKAQRNFTRPGEPDHARWESQRQLRARL